MYIVNDTNPNVIGITEAWANTSITDAELGLPGYVLFRKDRRRKGCMILHIKKSLLGNNATHDEAVWC